MATLGKSTLFPATLVTEMYSKVKGHSSLARMAATEPIPFNGKDVFVFNFANKVSVVGESQPKPAGDAVITSKQIRPIKVVYQSRVSEEFQYAAEETRLQYLREFADGFARKLAEGFDEMAMHGVNPAAGTASTVIGNNHFDYELANYNSGSNVITYVAATPDANIDAAIAKVEGDVNGMILGPTIRTAIAGLTVNGGVKYPEFTWGRTPEELGGIRVDKNSTLEANSSKDRALVGDFNAFRWGFAKELPLEVIEYGNPDGGTYDLKRNNEVLLRSEAYIGWAILDPAAFALVEAE